MHRTKGIVHCNRLPCFIAVLTSIPTPHSTLLIHPIERTAVMFRLVMSSDLLLHAEIGGLSRDKQTNDKTEKAKDGAENLDDEDLDEPLYMR